MARGFGEIRPDPRRFGTSRYSAVYGYERYAYDHMTIWNVRGPNGHMHDMGLDHFVLTAGDEFERVEFRVGGSTVEELACSRPPFRRV